VKQRIVRLLAALSIAVIILICLAHTVYAGTTGIVSGIVKDSSDNKALAGVNIVIEGTNLTTVTDENGYYVITNVPPGDHKITASLVGYADAVIEKVTVLMDVTATTDFSLKQSVAEEDQVVVKESRPMVQRDVAPTMYIVDKKQEQAMRSDPNLLYQSPGLSRTQPGVVLEADSTVHIRGGRADEIGWMVDGIPVQDPISGGFGTNLVTIGMDKMELFTGGYRPEYGNAISGIMNEVIKTGRTSPGFGLQMLSGGQSFQGIYPEIGGYTDKGFDYYLGAYLWRTDLEETMWSNIKDADMAGKFNFSLGNKNKVTVLLNQGSADLQFPSFHDQTFANGGLISTPLTQDIQHQSYMLSAVTLTHTINSNSFVSFSPYSFVTKTSDDAAGQGFWLKSASNISGFKADYTNQVTPNQLLKLGASSIYGKNRFFVMYPGSGDPSNSIGDFAYNANADTKQTAFYAQDQFLLGEKWTLECGMRYDQMTYDKIAHPNTTDSQLSPRFGMTYLANPRTKFRFSWGQMIQFPRSQAAERIYVDPIWETWMGKANADLKPERCTQFDLGWERQVSADYSVQITPFYRKYRNMLQKELIDPTDIYGPSNFVNTGEGNGQGIELLVKKAQSNNWTGWLSYTYMETKAQASSDSFTVTPGQTYYVDWDQRHTLSLVLNYAKNGWSVSMIGEYGSGFPYGDSNEKRMRHHQTVDLNVSRDVKSLWLGEGRFNLGISNIFNVHNALSAHMAGNTRVNDTFVTPRFINFSYSRKM